MDQNLTEQQNKVENWINGLQKPIQEKILDILKRKQSEDPGFNLYGDYGNSDILEDYENDLYYIINSNMEKDKSFDIRLAWFLYEIEIERLFPCVDLEAGESEHIKGYKRSLCYEDKQYHLANYILLKIADNIDLNYIKDLAKNE